MGKGEAVKVSVDSRVILDTTFLRKMNPNYVRPQPNKLVKKMIDKDNWGEIFLESFSEGSLN